MIPEHYLHAMLGFLPGLILGFSFGGFITALFAHRRMRRISTREWLAARKFYTGQPTNPFT